MSKTIPQLNPALSLSTTNKMEISQSDVPGVDSLSATLNQVITDIVNPNAQIDESQVTNLVADLTDIKNKIIDLENYIISNVYVSPSNGSDITGDGSIYNPFASINYALSQITGTPTNRYNIVLSAEIYVESSSVLIKPFVYFVGNNATININGNLSLSTDWDINFSGETATFFCKNLTLSTTTDNDFNFSPFTPQPVFLSFNDLRISSGINIAGNGNQIINIKDCGDLDSGGVLNFLDVTSYTISGGNFSEINTQNFSNANGTFAFITSCLVVSSITTSCEIGFPIQQFILGDFLFGSISAAGSDCILLTDCNTTNTPTLLGGAQWQKLSIGASVRVDYNPINYITAGNSADQNLEGIDNYLGFLKSYNEITITLNTILSAPLAAYANVNMGLTSQTITLPIANDGVNPLIPIGKIIYIRTNPLSFSYDINYGDNTLFRAAILPGQNYWLLLSNNNTQNGTWQIITSVSSVNGNYGDLSLDGTNLSAAYPTPTNYAPITAYITGHLQGINNALVSGLPPGGAAGGDLTGTYPNPTIANNAVTTAKINNGAVDLTSKVSGILPIANGGTNINTYALGDTIYCSAANILARLPGNTSLTKEYLSQTGTGSVSSAPAWSAISGTDITGNALTSANDTNVSLTLGGTPATSLLRSASITAGWIGQLSVARGGTGLSAGISGGIPYYSATSTIASSSVLGSNQLVIGGGTAVAPSTNANLTYNGTALNVSGGAANTITRLLTLQSPRSFAPADDGLLLAGLASNGTVGLHDYGAIVMGSNPGNSNGGASIFQLRVGGSSTSTTNNGLFLQATTTGTNSTTEISFYTGASTKIAAFNSAGVLNLSSLTPSQIVFTDASKNLTSVSVLPITNGGTNISTYTLGDTLYASAANTLSKLAGNTTAIKLFLTQTGTGTVSAAPVWSAISGSDITGAALTRVNDTNVSLTLGGTPTTALLQATSVTAGWLGQLSVPRGGTGLSTGVSGGIPYFNSTTTMTSTSVLGSNQIMLGGGALAAPYTNSGFFYDPGNGIAVLSTAAISASWRIITTSVTGGNEASVVLDRGTLAGGYAQLHLWTSGVEDWSIGTLANSQNITFQLNSTSVPFTFTPTGSLTATGASAATVIRATTTLTGTANEGSFYARRGDSANGYAQLALFTGATADWYLGTRPGSTNMRMYATGSRNAVVYDMSQSGTLSLPYNPSFRAYLSATTTGVTGSGTVYPLVCDAVVADQNSNYSAGSGNFTAPITGNYKFMLTLTINNIVSQNTQLDMEIVANSVRYNIFNLSPYPISFLDAGTSAQTLTLTGDLYVRLTAGQVAFPQLTVAGFISDNIRVVGGDIQTSFSGFLVS